MPSQETLAKAVEALTPRELDAYQRYMVSGKPPLAPSTAASFFALYLQGHSCEEIARLNPAFGLGIIVRARIDFEWDQQRLEHTQRLMNSVQQTVQTTQLEAIQFVTDGLAAFQKFAGEKFQRYLQTGKAEDLGDFKDMNLKQYKEMLELLLKLTGQEPARKVQGVVEHHHTVEAADGPVVQVNAPMSAATAHDFLAQFDKVKS